MSLPSSLLAVPTGSHAQLSLTRNSQLSGLIPLYPNRGIAAKQPESLLHWSDASLFKLSLCELLLCDSGVLTF
ncbi:hypothetical protein AOQ84DRAFT_356676 [Glonium stellatum]|uniref:Uncharacterized protein n=1 Tax=Glonium stellatum TaxID=574774 RepID=A0A8E2JNL2_9PEZI|nr:hypothetical protein AOQ84DRAFT_356676 [Glonium stellatum]